jgi:hypothetical protein
MAGTGYIESPGRISMKGGQTLMKRREALFAKDEGRKPRTPYAWDFLLGVEDVSRSGALRYRRGSEEAFLAHDALTVPPIANLGELEVVAREITAKRIDDLTALRQWLKVLVAPGASLGGARPRPASPKPMAACGPPSFPPAMTPAMSAPGRRSRSIWQPKQASRCRPQSCAASAASTHLLCADAQDRQGRH